jgi:cell division protein FtsZ
MRQNVDTLLIINNERLREFGKNMSLSEAFSHADDVLTVAAKGIAEVISVTGAINVDFNDVNTVMRNSGHAIMGSASAAGEDRAVVAVKNALNSPLLYDNDINGARYVLLNISYGDREVMMDEITDITDYIQEAAGSTADVIWGHGHDASLGDQLSLTIIATGFSSSPLTGFEKSPERTVVVLEEEKKQEITAPLSSPFESIATAPVAHVTEEPFMKQVEAPLTNPFQTVETPIDAVAVSPKTTFNLYDEQEEVVSAAQTSMSWEVFDVQADAITPTQAAPTFEQEVVKHVLEDDSQMRVELEMPRRILSPEEQQRKNQERVSRIQEFTSKLKKPDGLLEFENEPAFVRRNIQLQQQSPSSQEEISRFGIGKDANGNSTLRSNNFLHDNVD